MADQGSNTPPKRWSKDMASAYKPSFAAKVRGNPDLSENGVPLSCIYLIRISEDILKLGKAHHPAERLKSLQTGQAQDLKLEFVVRLPLADVSRVESSAHAKLAAHRVRGEMFRVGLDVAIKAIRDSIDYGDFPLAGTLNDLWSEPPHAEWKS